MPSFRTLVVDPSKYPRQRFCQHCKYFGKFYMQLASGKWSYQMCGRCMIKKGPFKNHLLAGDDVCKNFEWNDESLTYFSELEKQGLYAPIKQENKQE